MTLEPDTLRLIAELDQLNEGLKRGELDAVLHSRKTLALIARDGSPVLLKLIFDAIAFTLNEIR